MPRQGHIQRIDDVGIVADGHCLNFQENRGGEKQREKKLHELWQDYDARGIDVGVNNQRRGNKDTEQQIFLGTQPKKKKSESHPKHKTELLRAAVKVREIDCA